MIARPGTTGWTIPGTPGCFLCAMTTRTDALHITSLELARRSRSPEGTRTLRRFASAGLDVGDATSLAELVDSCQRHPRSRSRASDELLEGLLALAPRDRDAALCAIVARRPALLWVTARVFGPGAVDDDAVAEVVARAWEAIRSPRPACTSLARAVVVEVRETVRRAARDMERRVTEVAMDPEWDWPASRPDPVTYAEPLLARAVEAGWVRRDDAEVIALTRGAGVPLEEVASARGMARGTLLRRRLRAEAALRTGIQLEVRSR